VAVKWPTAVADRRGRQVAVKWPTAVADGRRRGYDPDPEPLSPGRWKLQVTLSQSGHDKLKRLQALLAHQIRNRDLAAIVERALDALLTQVQKRKTGMTDKPRASKPAGKPRRTDRRTRHVAAAARREVWPRDHGRCGFVGEDGHRCNETRGLHFAHIEPWAKGGANTADNLALRCPTHNALEADRDYGANFMANKRKKKARPAKPAVDPLKVREPLAQYVTRSVQLVSREPEPGNQVLGVSGAGTVLPTDRGASSRCRITYLPHRPLLQRSQNPLSPGPCEPNGV